MREKTKEENFAYLAGLFDGEGHVGSTISNGTPVLRVKLGMLDKSSVQFIKSTLRVGKVYRGFDKKTQKQYFLFSADSYADMFYVLNCLKLYSITKRRHIELALKFLKGRLLYPHSRITKDEIELLHEIKDLNNIKIKERFIS